MARHPVWELVFLMLILKIPIVYLCLVVYWAIRAEPRPEEGAAVTVGLGPDDRGWWGRRPLVRRRRPRPHGGPSRSYPRAPGPAVAHGTAKRR